MPLISASFLSYTETPICTAFFARPAYPRIMTDTLLKEKSVNKFCLLMLTDLWYNSAVSLK